MPGSPTFNGSLFNSKLWNGGRFSSVVYSQDTLVFYDANENAFSLSDGADLVLTGLKISGPTRDILGGSVPRDHGGFVNADFFREQVIEATGYLKQDTAAELDAFIDTMKKSLRQREGSLDYIDQNGTVRRYTVTVDNYDEMFDREPYDITKINWTVRFRCKTPFARSRSYTTTTETVTSSPTNLIYSTTGTFRTLPIFMLNFDSASSVTVVNLKRINVMGTTLEEIEYSGSISASDLLIFDGEEKSATKNGSEVSYTGSFLTMEPGSNIFTVTVTGSAFSALVTNKFRDCYL